MVLKINSGWSRGLSLKSPAGSHTRPTTARLREAAWNSLQFFLPDAKVLDVFAGSGVVGLEALSRGASAVTFIDNDKNALSCLQTNLNLLENRAKSNKTSFDASIMAGSFEIMKTLQPGSFDVIWADPPYADLKKFLEIFITVGPKLLSSEGRFVLECSSDDKANLEQLFRHEDWGFMQTKQKKVASSLLSIFVRKE